MPKTTMILNTCRRYKHVSNHHYEYPIKKAYSKQKSEIYLIILGNGRAVGKKNDEELRQVKVC